MRGPGLLLVLGCAACSFDWDGLDPRLTDEATVGAGGSVSSASAPGGAGQGGMTVGPGSGGSTGGGGPGGGGAGDTVPAADWTGSFDAVYRFDNAILGLDAAGDNDLVSKGTPSLETDAAQQGTGCAYFDANDDGLVGTHGIFDTPAGASFTAGAWARIDDLGAAGDADILHKREPSVGGFKLFAKRANPRASCLVESAAGLIEAQTPVNSVAEGVWWHGVCQHDAVNDQVRLSFNGTTSTTQPSMGIAGVGQELGISDTTTPDPVLGCVDEAFFVRRVLSAEAIQRVWACGIGGTRCTCSASAPAEYVSCGRATDCAGLIACNAEAPTFLD